jgi:hypothetical protein
VKRLYGPLGRTRGTQGGWAPGDSRVTGIRGAHRPRRTHDKHECGQSNGDRAETNDFAARHGIV